jgi:uncharacterized protein (DUF488 family)
VNSVVTIGVYGLDAETFFQRLEQSDIDLFLDLRRRRGVRGSEYTFANAQRLIAKLERRGIAHRHILDLAPSNATRTVQYEVDAAKHIARRARTTLNAGCRADYTTSVLDVFDWNALLDDLNAYRNPVLFCVERLPEACHRHLVAERLTALSGVPRSDIVP